MFYLLLLVIASSAFGQTGSKEDRTSKMTFTISMKDPGSQCYQVVFRCDNLTGQTQDFKMPVWTPGYYSVFDFAANVQDFRAEDGRGNPLKWEKTANNTWTVQSENAAAIVVHYNVKAAASFVANSRLDENKGYIVPTDVCLYVDGLIQHPVTLNINLNPQWNTIATGLDPVSADRPHIYFVPNFDVLYDSPIMMGNLESLPPFEIQGVPHYFIGYDLGTFDHEHFMNDLKSAIEEGIAIIGEIPYRHYTFIGIGPGLGGIEHLNSASLSFSGEHLEGKTERTRSLLYLAHEYFHLYNVKRIRPIALGPFDYDKPNLTNMLWVSEGFTVYYEYLMLARAGLITQQQFLEKIQEHITSYESNTGRFFQSATQSSYDTWKQGPFGGSEERGNVRKTISYYNKGPILGFLLDLKIRHETQNKKSLDDVMRTLYFTYYKDKQRGFTDDEFRQVCENVAGCDLTELFEYASTTREIDYSKYLVYAGLELEEFKKLPDAYLGIIAEDQEDKLVVAAVEPGSPAQKVGVTAQDIIKSADGKPVNAKAFDDMVSSKKPGDLIGLFYSHSNQDCKVDITLDHKLEKLFYMKSVYNPEPLQIEILDSLTKSQVK